MFVLPRVGFASDSAVRFEAIVSPLVIAGLVPAISLRKAVPSYSGWHRKSGLPDFRTIDCRKSGKPTCGDKPGHDEHQVSALPPNFLRQIDDHLQLRPLLFL